MTENELRDMADSACQEALAFGVSADAFLKLARSVAAKCAAAQPAPAPSDAEEWLLQRFGVVRGHPEWRALVEAFNTGRATQPAPESSDEIAKLKTVMIAAAEEIAAHWDAHCDAEGYGPVNLLRRLEEGIPAEYGYTAGAFATLKAERDAATTQPAPAAVPAGWISVAEKMPPPDAWLLVVWGDHKAVDKAHTFSKWKHPSNPLGYLIQGHPGSHNAVTYWQILPAAPAPATGGEHE